MDGLVLKLNEYGISVKEQMNFPKQEFSFKRIVREFRNQYGNSEGILTNEEAFKAFTRSLIEEKLFLQITSPEQLIVKIGIPNKEKNLVELFFLNTIIRWNEQLKKIKVMDDTKEGLIYDMMKMAVKVNVEYIGIQYPEWKMKHRFNEKKAEKELVAKSLEDRKKMIQRINWEMEENPLESIEALMRAEVKRVW